MIFPKTAFAPTDLEEWLRVMKISKSYGMNHYRYHTCCPPEAAFIAADMLGIYMEPQLPFWGTITEEGEENHNQEEQDFLVEEGFNMLKFFGNHPSYCMMSMGNELWGSKKILNDIIGGYKKFDSRHLYTQGSNNFQWFPNVIENDDFFVGVRLANDRLIRGSYAMCDAPLGHIQTDKPAANHDYDSIIRPKKQASSTEISEDGTVQIQYGTTMKTVKASEADADFIPEVPIVTHEIGQYETYPNFKEIEKYTGSLKARNFEVFRERLEKRVCFRWLRIISNAQASLLCSAIRKKWRLFSAQDFLAVSRYSIFRISAVRVLPLWVYLTHSWTARDLSQTASGESSAMMLL